MIRDPFVTRPNSFLFLIIGPSGVGKNFLIEGLLKSPAIGRNLEFLITHTSRKPRGKEQKSIHYYFVKPKEFKQLIAKDFFAEYNEVYPGKYYGTSYDEIDRVISQHGHGITDMDVDGALALKLHFPKNVHTIFLQPQSVEQAIAQLKSRSVSDGVNEKDLEDRIKRFEYEMGMKHKFDSLITSVAKEPSQALEFVSSIMHKKMYQGNQAFQC